VLVHPGLGVGEGGCDDLVESFLPFSKSGKNFLFFSKGTPHVTQDKVDQWNTFFFFLFFKLLFGLGGDVWQFVQAFSF
jgi:hypothetical protein